MDSEKKYHFKDFKGPPIKNRKPFNIDDWNKEWRETLKQCNIIIEQINDCWDCNRFKVGSESKDIYIPLIGLEYNDFSAFGDELKSGCISEIEPGIYVNNKIDGLIRPKRKNSIGIFRESLIRM